MIVVKKCLRPLGVIILLFSVPSLADIDNDIISLMDQSPYASPSSDVAISTSQDSLAFTVQTMGNGVTVGFDVDHPPKPIDPSVHRFFHFVARGTVPITVSRIVFYDSDGDTLTFEPDRSIRVHTTHQTIFMDKCTEEGNFGTVARVRFTLWMPQSAGTPYTLDILGAEFRTLPYTREADASSPFLASSRHEDIPEQYRKWVQIAPGGGGWFRCLEFSPITKKLLVGGDVGGVYVSSPDYRSFETHNLHLTNRYVMGIYFHPTDPDVIFLGTRGGVARSTDGGNTWEMCRNGFRPRETFGRPASVWAMAIDPVDPDIVYAGLGDERDPTGPSVLGYVYKSTDGGDNWTEIDLANGAISDESIVSITIDPTDHNSVLVLSQSRLFSSSDAGATWTQLDTLPFSGKVYTCLVMKRDQPDTLLVSYWERDGTTGIIKSVDRGASWLPSPVIEMTGVGLKTGFRRIKPHPSDTDTFFAPFHRGQGGIYRTTDAGETWSDISDSEEADYTHWHGYGTTATDFSIDPNDPNTMCYINDMEIYLSSDGGKNWLDISSERVTEATSESAPRYRSTGANILCATDVAIDPRDPKKIFLAYWDVTLWKTDDGGQSLWRLNAGGLGNRWGKARALSIDPNYPDVVFVALGHNYTDQAIYRSVDGGKVFEPCAIAQTGFCDKAFVADIEIDASSPVSSRVVFAAVSGNDPENFEEDGVYRSTNWGLSWTRYNNGLPPDNRNITSIAIDHADSNKVYVTAKRRSTGAEIYTGYIARSLDGGLTWNTVLEGIDAYTVIVDPFDHNIVYAGQRDYSGHALDHIFWKSTDGGDTWTYKTGSENFTFPFLDENAGDKGLRWYLATLAADPAREGRLYAGFVSHGYDYGFGGGLFYSDNKGETWHLFELNGLQTYSISRIIVDPINTSRLYVASGGNDVWRFGTPPQFDDSQTDGGTSDGTADDGGAYDGNDGETEGVDEGDAGEPDLDIGQDAGGDEIEDSGYDSGPGFDAAADIDESGDRDKLPSNIQGSCGCGLTKGADTSPGYDGLLVFLLCCFFFVTKKRT